MTTTGKNDQIVTIEIDKISPDPGQPRKYFDQVHLDNLKHSIETISQLEPILVRHDHSKPDHYVIVDGERRWRALKELEFTEIKCRIVALESDDYEIISLTQNIHREDLLPIEKALAVAKLLHKMKGENEKVRQRQLIKKVNLSETYISELLKISTLEEEIKKEAIKSNLWSGAKLLHLSKIKDKEERRRKFEELKEKISKKIEKKITPTPGRDRSGRSMLERHEKSLLRNADTLYKRLEELTKHLHKTEINNSELMILDDIQAKLSNISVLLKGFMPPREDK
ncbi:MAG: ParB/RepB/Spo0J family partition protein [Deltaproteobacteria bacterium]|jgi:ParB family chromosome partitioning protein|nr:ParB/RepB/Spo0J family partition protein [Deltaproteobacteria bacterium]